MAKVDIVDSMTKRVFYARRPGKYYNQILGEVITVGNLDFFAASEQSDVKGILYEYIVYTRDRTSGVVTKFLGPFDCRKHVMRVLKLEADVYRYKPREATV